MAWGWGVVCPARARWVRSCPLVVRGVGCCLVESSTFLAVCARVGVGGGVTCCWVLRDQAPLDAAVCRLPCVVGGGWWWGWVGFFGLGSLAAAGWWWSGVVGFVV